MEEPNNRASTVKFSSSANLDFYGDNISQYSDSALNKKAGKLRPLSGQSKQQSFISSRPLTAVAHEMVQDIDHKVANLKEIFKKTDPLEERRMCAVKIQALIRGFLARVRKHSYEQATRDWRWMRCRPVIWLLDILLANQSKLDSGFHLLTMNRVMRTLFAVFGKWAIVSKQNAPMRRQVKIQAEEKIATKRQDFMKTYFDAFKAVTTGAISRKKANAVRMELIDRIRKDLSNYLKEKGLIGIVPPHEVQKMLNRRVIDEFNIRKKVIVTKGIFNRFKKIVAMSKKFERDAEYFRFKKLAGTSFYAWSDYTYLKSLGLDRKRWPGPRKYEVRYNQKRVDNFSRIRCERSIFKAWKAYFSIQLKVKRSYQKKLSQFISRVFHAWKGISNHQRRLRKITHENWTGYSNLMVSKPFRGKKLYYFTVKSQLIVLYCVCFHSSLVRVCKRVEK